MNVAANLWVDGTRIGRLFVAIAIVAVLGAAKVTMLVLELPSLMAAYGDDP